MPLKVLYDGRGAGELEPEIDIVAIHGLNPFNSADHGFDTWRKPAGEDGHIWLRDSLPKCLPTARTMLYNYNSSPVFGSGKDRFVVEASQFLESLSVKRYEFPNRPLILVGHSLGGILIKQTLVNAHANPKHTDIITATFALVFMGTPHSGPADSSKVLFGKTCAKIVKKVHGNASNDLMEAVQNGSLFYDVLKENWRHQLENYQIISCYETIDEIVPYNSAVLGLPGNRETILRRRSNHSDVCRFDPEDEIDEEDFEIFEGNLRRLCREALKEVYEVKAKIAESLQNKILGSLQILASNPRYGKIESEYESTLRWIWTSIGDRGPGLLEWLESDDPLFWISGKPGAGKSTLMKYIYNDGMTSQTLRGARSGNILQISFFFHELGTPSEGTFSGMLHALLYQLLKKLPVLATAVHARFQRLETRSPHSSQESGIWTESELEKAFQDILPAQTTNTTLLCVVDGLDECEAKSQRQALQFLLGLSAPASKGRLRFKILCSSRPENIFELAFVKYHWIKVQDFTYHDIHTFVSRMFATVTSNLYHADKAIKVSGRIISDIVQKAEGVFIWVKLVVAELIIAIEAGDFEVLDEKLNNLPSDLEDLYARIIDKIPVEIRHHTFNYLQLFIGADERENFMLEAGPSNIFGMTLAIQHPEEALTFSPTTMTDEDKISDCAKIKRILQDRCRGFINLPSWSQDEPMKYFCQGQVSIHKTVLDYLFSGKKIQKFFSGIEPSLLQDKYVQRAAFYFRLLKLDLTTRKQVNRDIDSEEVCTRLLSSLEGSERFSQAPLTHEFLPALEAHLKTSFQDAEELERFYDQLTGIRAGGQLNSAFEFYAENQAARTAPLWHSNLLSVAVFYNLRSFLEDQIWNQEHTQKAGRPLLHYFLSRETDGKRYDLLRLLLENGCRTDTKFNSGTTWEHLLMKVYWDPNYLGTSHIDKVILLFLEFGANPRQWLDICGYQCSGLHAMLSFYIPYERLEPVLLEFLKRGADVTAKDSKGFSVIELAQNWPQAIDLLSRYLPDRKNS